MNLNQVEKVDLTLKPGSELMTVSITAKDGAVQAFTCDSNEVSALLSRNVSTEFMPVSQDGVVHFQERGNNRLVVVQRGRRKKQRIFFEESNREYITDTPWTVFMFIVQRNNKNFTKIAERIYITDGPLLSFASTIYEAEWMGNIHPDGTYRATNICWGSTNIAPGGVVSMGSLVNIANDFYSTNFTPHLGIKYAAWEKFKDSGQFPKTKASTVEAKMNSLWAQFER